MSQLYHYTTGAKWREIQKEAKLIPIGRLIVDVLGIPQPERRDAGNGAIWGFQEMEPKSWLENEEFPYIFGKLLCKTGYSDGVVILRVNLSSDYQPQVFDWAQIERDKNPDGVAHSSWRKYWESRLPLDQYQKEYSLPEIVIRKEVGLERISLVQEINPEDTQRKFEKHLRLYREFNERL